MSAAPQEIVEPLAHSLGMTSGIGTRSVVVDGMYTGALDGPFCYGEGKVEAMRELANWHGLRPRRSATRTATRRATCRCSRRSAIPSPSTPTGELERHARRHGWPIVIFSQRTKSVIRRTVASAATVGIAGASFAAGTALAGSRNAGRSSSRRR